MTKLKVELGKSSNNKPFIYNPLETPNLLITSNNYEKNIVLNQLINTLIKNNSKTSVQIALIDYENKNYSFLENDKHLFLPISHDKDFTDNLLKFLTTLKTNRQFLLKKCNVHNIEQYNKQENNKLSYVFLIVDEFEFLHKHNQIEQLLNLLNTARACGIFIIIATNNPSKKVITSNIKVNFIDTISFKLKSQEDLKWITDISNPPNLTQNEFLAIRPLYDDESIIFEL